jgi:hypothetical protein
MIKAGTTGRPNIKIIAPNDSVILNSIQYDRADWVDYKLTKTGKFTISIQENEGDDVFDYQLSLTATSLIHDALTQSIISPDTIMTIGQKFAPSAVVRNNGKNADTITAYFKIDSLYSDSVKLFLASNSKDTAMFKPCSLMIARNYTVICSTFTSDELYLKNNVKQITVTVKSPVAVAAKTVAVPQTYSLSVLGCNTGTLICRFLNKNGNHLGSEM